MAGKRGLRLVVTVGVAAVVVVVGAGAYAFGSVTTVGGHNRAVGAAGTTGESASPGTTSSRDATPVPGTTSAAPDPAVTAADPAAPPPVPAECRDGERQQEVESYLARLDGYGPVVVDGVQTAADCAAISKFQDRYGISPAEGRAGPTTAGVARRIVTSMDAEERAKCRVDGPALTICVDLTQQTAWAVRNGAVVWGPTVIRTGMRGGYQTPTGTYRIYGRNQREWSVPYKVWLPYWQAFNGGIGFHETTTYIHDGALGSHGCVNLLHADAVALWKLGSVGTTVQVFGNRPGT
ncbi:L,D-transpeptidase family protein [Planosporangium sp. 12N6]|uniref:L,D-transpeptidase family protein n=1 Tax=Planosporangium spinosum TaxID=3402278 RepID=UPI003CF982DB